MKTYLTKLSSSFLLLTLSFSIWAKPVAQVVSVTGTVFVVTPDGKTSALKLNQHLEDQSDVMVEEGASISLNDYYDATYHLAGGSHLKFFNKSVQLKKGKTWVQSASSKYSLALTTANGNAGFTKGEFITTFDQSSSRSQFLVVSGDVEVSNILDENNKQTVGAGSFTIVDPEIENGSPRVPTKVGLASLNQALSEFKQIPQKTNVTETVRREVASVEPVPEVKKGEIIFIKSTRMPASVKPESAHEYYKKIVSKKIKFSSVPIRFYGMNKSPSIILTPRTPASVPVSGVSMKKPASYSDLKIDQEFSDSLKEHQKEQPKYKKELENLVNDLKSYE